MLFMPSLDCPYMAHGCYRRLGIFSGSAYSGLEIRSPVQLERDQSNVYSAIYGIYKAHLVVQGLEAGTGKEPFLLRTWRSA